MSAEKRLEVNAGKTSVTRDSPDKTHRTHNQTDRRSSMNTNSQQKICGLFLANKKRIQSLKQSESREGCQFKNFKCPYTKLIVFFCFFYINKIKMMIY